MKCRPNRCLLVAVVFILATACPTTASSLMEAASKGDTEKVQALLAHGADVNAQTIYGETALIKAEKRGHREIIQLLKDAVAKE